MNKLQKDLHQWLTNSVSMRRSILAGNQFKHELKYVCPEDIVLQHGSMFKKKAKITKPMERGWCFNNACELAASRDDLDYCEGYGLAAHAIPVHHAWCVDQEGTIYDPTWAEMTYTADMYMGVIFDRQWYGQYLRKHRYPSIFVKNEMVNIPILEGKFKLKKAC